MKFGAIFFAAALAVGACAKPAERVASAYVSPIPYQSFTCVQIGQEAERLSARVIELTGLQNKKATGDAVATTVAIVVFWPAAFFIGGDDATTAELARLKGEMDAIERISIEKKCGIVFEHPPPPPTAEEIRMQREAERNAK